MSLRVRVLPVQAALDGSPELITVRPLLVDAAAAARVLAVSERTVWALVADGDLSSVRLGPRMTRFRLSDLEAYVQALPTDAPSRKEAAS